MARLDKMTKPQLINVIERDAVTVRRARQAMADLAALQDRLNAANDALATEKAKPPREVPGPERIVTNRVEVPGPERVVEKLVPTPCPDQARRVADLEAALVRAERDAAEKQQAADAEAATLRAKIDAMAAREKKPETIIQRVPEPCPKQAAEIEALKAKLNNSEFQKWLRMVEVAKAAGK